MLTLLWESFDITEYKPLKYGGFNAYQSLDKRPRQRTLRAVNSMRGELKGVYIGNSKEVPVASRVI